MAAEGRSCVAKLDWLMAPSICTSKDHPWLSEYTDKCLWMTESIGTYRFSTVPRLKFKPIPDCTLTDEHDYESDIREMCK